MINPKTFSELVNRELQTTYNAYSKFGRCFAIKKVIFNPPATIVLWADGTKTVVKAQGKDNFNPEVGMAMCFMKRAYGNKGRYNNDLKKYTEPYYEKLERLENELIEHILNTSADTPEEKCTWKIFVKYYRDGELVGIERHHRDYGRKCDATRIANQQYSDLPDVIVIVTQAEEVE